MEYSAKTLSGNVMHVTFRKRELFPLFDRQWHKLAINVKSGLVSLYKDCELVDSKRSEELENIDVQGKTAIGLRVSDEIPIDVSNCQRPPRDEVTLYSILYIIRLELFEISFWECLFHDFTVW